MRNLIYSSASWYAIIFTRVRLGIFARIHQQAWSEIRGSSNRSRLSDGQDLIRVYYDGKEVRKYVISGVVHDLVTFNRQKNLLYLSFLS